jgi:Ribosomal protein L11 methyltransferase (PrmA)
VRLGPRFSMDLAGSDLRLDVNGIQKQFPRGILQLLAFYQEPHTLEEGLHLLAPSTKGMQGLAEAFTRLLELCEQGVLVPDNKAPRSNWQPEEQVYGPSAQIRMLEDRVRTLRFIRAIRRTVRSGDVVVDLGTGSGVLAVAAAQAGAKHVYAIEVRPIADVAARLFQASGLSDRITLIRGTSTEIELPERADVLVSEMIGNEPLGERILETTCDADLRDARGRAQEGSGTGLLYPRGCRPLAALVRRTLLRTLGSRGRGCDPGQSRADIRGPLDRPQVAPAGSARPPPGL